jgi:hypothetical protein
MKYLIYLIKDVDQPDGDIRLVRAGSPAQVMRHLMKNRFIIEKPSTAEVADYMEAGIPIERVDNNDLEN